MQRVLLLLLYCCSFLASADDTVLKLYRPFGEVYEQIAPEVKTKLAGECVAQSRLILREDAWRCQAEGKVFDPCFVRVAGEKREAICPQSPWVGDSVLIEAGSPLNNKEHTRLDMSRTYPWAVELVNGERCQAVETDEVVDSMPVRYRCANQHVLIGYLQRCKSVWSMLEKTSSGVGSIDFKRVWF